jgi:hypothetical protein
MTNSAKLAISEGLQRDMLFILAAKIKATGNLLYCVHARVNDETPAGQLAGIPNNKLAGWLGEIYKQIIGLNKLVETMRLAYSAEVGGSKEVGRRHIAHIRLILEVSDKPEKVSK